MTRYVVSVNLTVEAESEAEADTKVTILLDNLLWKKSYALQEFDIVDAFREDGGTD